MVLKDFCDRCGNAVRRLTGSKKGLAVCTALGIGSMLLILFSGGDKTDDKKDMQKMQNSTETVSEKGTEFVRDTEERLEGILSSIEGVGKVRVMITASGSEEYVFAESESISAGKEDRKHVILKNGSSEEALVKNVISPGITGVVVVCEGGGSDRVREDVYRAVTAALGISSGKVYVAKMK